MINNLGIRTKLLLLICCAAALLSAGILLIAGWYTSETLSSEAVRIAELEGTTIGLSVDAALEIPLDEARSLANSLVSIKNDSLPVLFTREQINAFLRSIVQNGENFLGAYVAWEPDAFDGNDGRYKNAPGHDSSGRFIPYWNRAAGSISVEPLKFYEGANGFEYYKLPKRTRREYVNNPIIYPTDSIPVLMTSAVVPIVHDSTFYGVAGIDVRLTFTQLLIDTVVTPYTDMYIAIISNNGLLAGVRNKPELLGKPAKDYLPDYSQQMVETVLRTGRPETRFNSATGNLQSIIPVEFGTSPLRWVIVVNIPEAEIFAGRTRMLWMLGLTEVLLSCIIIVAAWVSGNRLTLPLQRLQTAANDLKSGNYNVHVAITGNDEIGALGSAFNALAQQIREDTASQEAAEAELRKSRQQLYDLTANIPGVVYQFYVRPDGSMGFYFISERTTEIFGIPNNPTTFFSDFIACLSEEDRVQFLESIDVVVAMAAHWGYEAKFTKPDGNVIWFSGKSSPQVLHHEIVYNGILFDITEHVKMYERLRQNEEFLNSIYTGVAYGIVVFDITEDGRYRVVGVNPYYLSILNFTPDITINRFYDEMGDIIPQSAIDLCIHHMDAVVRDGSVIDYERPDFEGGNRLFHTRLTPLRNEAGKIYRIIGTVTDITEAKRQEEERLFVKRLEKEKQSLEIRTELLRLTQVNVNTMKEALQEILPALTRLTNAEFAAYRQFDPISESFIRIHSYGIELNAAEQEQSERPVPKNECGGFFGDFLCEETMTTIEDIRQHPEFATLRNFGFITENTVSLLLASVWHRNELKGVLSIESAALPRQWQPEELDVAASIARTISYLYESFDHAQAQRLLAETENKFTHIFQESETPMAIHDAETAKFQMINTAFSRTFGYSSEEVLGKTAMELGMIIQRNSEDGSDRKTRKAIQEEFQQNARVVSESQLRAKDGVIRDCLISVTQIPDKHMNFSTIVDISRQKQIQEQLKRARLEAEEANLAKSEFLANMSHEIRTPMNAILGFTEILRKQLPDERQRGYLNTIASSGRTLLTLINDILDLSKIEAGRLQLHVEPMDIISILQEIQAIFLPKIQEKNLEFVLQTDSDMPAGLMLDEVRFRQILFNLVGNAVKFTEEGFVSVKARITRAAAHPSDENGLYHLGLVLEVQDSGIGISPDQLDTIFEPFRQQEGQSVRKYGGTGLGLSITKRLTQAMNGTISVVSAQGVGSTFTIEFPAVEVGEFYKPPVTEVPDEVSMIDFGGRRILIVDDIAANRELLRSYLEGHNVIIDEAVNGLEAISYTQTHRPDAILMDLRMPVMNGIEASSMIKSNDATATIPIVAVTASAMVSEEEAILKICDGFLRKPVGRSELLTELYNFFATPDNTGTSLAQQEGVAASSVKSPERSAAERAFAHRLSEQYLQQWQTLCKLNHIPRIKEFAHNLRGEATTESIPAVLNYANALLESCERFDVASVKTRMQNFPAIIESLSL